MNKKLFVGLIFSLLALCACGSPSAQPNRGTPPSTLNGISISPTSALVGSADVLLTITGSNFAGGHHNHSQVVWSTHGSETPLATTFVSSTQVIAVVPAELLISPVNAEVFVLTGDPMDDLPPRKSGPATFSVTALPIGAATISSISPESVSAGSPNITLTIMGSNFAGPPCLTCDSYSVVVWSISGSNTRLAATFVNSGELIASVPATLLIDPVTSRVFVQTWAGVQTDNEHLVSQTNEVIFSVVP